MEFWAWRRKQCCRFGDGNIRTILGRVDERYQDITRSITCIWESVKLDGTGIYIRAALLIQVLFKAGRRYTVDISDR